MSVGCGRLFRRMAGQAELSNARGTKGQVRQAKQAARERSFWTQNAKREKINILKLADTVLNHENGSCERLNIQTALLELELWECLRLAEAGRVAWGSLRLSVPRNAPRGLVAPQINL